MGNLKKILCASSFVSGIGLAITGMLIAPMGVIDGSVLIMAGQCLVFSAGIIGIKLKD